MTQPVESLGDELARSDPTFAHDASGAPISRQATCECGRRFRQLLLSERVLAMVESHSKRAMATFQQQVPGLYVPVHCPPCERRDLGHAARLAENRAEPVAPFGERADAAD